MAASPAAGRPVVFLDRDGTLNEEVGYIRDIARLVLVDGACEAVRALNRAGVAAVLVTNQTGAARGYYPEEHIVNLNERLTSLLQAGGASLDAVYYCPHYEGGVVPELSFACSCRKPLTGMVERALAENPQFDRRRLYVVGDKASDIDLARNCGGKGVLVTTGYGQQVVDGQYQWPVSPDYQARDIRDAVSWILDDLKDSL